MMLVRIFRSTSTNRSSYVFQIIHFVARKCIIFENKTLKKIVNRVIESRVDGKFYIYLNIFPLYFPPFFSGIILYEIGENKRLFRVHKLADTTSPVIRMKTARESIISVA